MSDSIKLPPLPEQAMTAVTSGPDGGEYRATADHYETFTARYSVEQMHAYARAAVALNAPTQTSAARDVLAERQRQIEAEGWTPEHDDAHSLGQMAEAAGCYASEAAESWGGLPACWPWSLEWWKPSTPRRNLVKAGALILAEIERLDRATALPAGPEAA